MCQTGTLIKSLPLALRQLFGYHLVLLASFGGEENVGLTHV